ncbi:hypothetical protein WS62_20740 [Burkholderia sp. ABCPW 14]|nr:hypothetical protein WS62_20740 [Burkholderia sp. ABCPW 14]
MTVVVTITAGYGVYRRFAAEDIIKDSLVACEGETISVSAKDGLMLRTLFYSISPLDGSAQFRYVDANGHVLAMRQMRLGQTSIKISRGRVLVSGVVTNFVGPGELPQNDPFLLQVRKGSPILIDLKLLKERVWNVGLGALDIGYCVMYD